MNNNIDWIIHLVANGACDECGKEEKRIPALYLQCAYSWHGEIWPSGFSSGPESSSP